MHKKIAMIFLAAVLLLGAFQTSQAALQAVGPVSPATGYFPVWYKDATRQLEICHSTTPSPDPAAAGAPMCVLLPVPGVYDPALPIVFPVNFPDENFYFSADARMAVGGVDLRYRAALEGAFATGEVINGDQITFARIRIFAQLPTVGTYTITHPYGVETFVVNTVSAGREIQFTRDIGIGAPGVFSGALAGNIGPWLVKSAVAGGAPAPIVVGTETFVGDPNVTQTVTGSPFGTNLVRIQGPGINLTTDQFAISGKIYGGILPTPLNIDRLTYNRTAAGAALVDVFATSGSFAPPAPAVAVSFRETVAPGTATPMVGDPATGKFFAHYAPAALPGSLIVEATQAGSPPSLLYSPVVDLVKITKATYSPDTKQMVIEASSSDQLTPLPVLTAVGWGTLSAPLIGITQSLVLANVPEPPARVTVKSSAGGSDTEPVVILPPSNPAPLAVNDTAATTSGIAVIINVLANDTDPNGNLPLTVSPADLTQPANGTAAINFDQTITYTPNVGFAGTDNFTYRAADSLGTLSNIAIVTVTVNDAPIANPDIASTTLGTAVVINVLANDTNAVGTLNPASVTITTLPLSGITSVNATTGAVTYTPNALFVGADTFSYTVADNLGAVSTAAIVTVTVSTNLPPVAVNDAASTTRNIAPVINVLANDSDPDGTLNPATVAIGTAPVSGTTSVNPLTGAVTYTPNLNFVGADSFTYTVQDNLAAVSNVATVTVTVTAPVNLPPVAVNDTAATPQGTLVTINVLANDSDPDGTLNPAAVTIGTLPISGTAVVNAVTGAVTYTPNAGFTGADSFTYTVRDNLAAVSNVATVAVNVTAPVAVDTITVTKVEYAGTKWNLEGRTTKPGAIITLHLGPLTGSVIARRASDANGFWRFNGTSPTVPSPGAIRTISIESTGGGTLLNVPLVVK